MRKGWETKQLREVCENLDSQRRPITKRNRSEGEIPYYGATGIVDYVNDYIFNEKLVLLGEDGAKWNSGDECAFIISGKTWVNNHAHVLRPNRKILLDEWIVYNLNFQDLSPYISGMTVPKLNQGRMNEIEIPIPPISEQKRIVTILYQTFAAIDKAKANAEKNLQNAKDLFESYLQNIFANPGENWEDKTLVEVCEFTQGIQRDVKLQSEIQKRNQVRFLRIVDFTQGNETPRFIDNPGEKYILNENDVSLVRYGASTGFVCRGLAGALANNLFRVIPKSLKEITNEFLFIFLKSPAFQNVIKESMNGAAMPAISFGMIRDIPIPVMTVKEQNALAAKHDTIFSEIKKLESIYQQKLDDLEELKKSILQKAFNGELSESRIEQIAG